MKPTSPQMMKDSLLDILTDMQTKLELFVERPGKDFTRELKLTFSRTIQLLLAAKRQYCPQRTA